MIRSGYSHLSLSLIALCLAQSLTAQSNPTEPPNLPYSEDILHQLPPAYRDEALKLRLTATEQEQRDALKAAAISSTAPTALAVHGMSSDPEGLQFLLQQLLHEPSPDNRSLILKAGIQPRIRHAKPGELPENVRETLLHLAQQDSDPTVSLEAVQALRRLQWGEYSQTLIARADKAR